MNVNESFELYPLKGAGVIKFGMSEADVASLLGACDDCIIDNSQLTEFRADMNFSYTKSANGELIHIGFGKYMNSVTFDGVNIFKSHPDLVIKKLIECDNAPYLSFGMVFFMKLGIYLTGFHDDDLDQKSLVLFKDKTYEQYIPEMELFIDVMKRKYGKTY